MKFILVAFLLYVHNFSNYTQLLKTFLYQLFLNCVTVRFVNIFVKPNNVFLYVFKYNLLLRKTNKQTNKQTCLIDSDL